MTYASSSVGYGHIPAFSGPFQGLWCASGRTPGVERQEPSLGDHQIGQGEQLVQVGRILGQSLVFLASPL